MKECPKCNLCFDDHHQLCPQDNETLFTSNKCSTTLSGRYILERRLGKGGMASVFKAKHQFLKSLHAVKIISPELVREDDSLLIRFRQEAILAASIYHPNVVNVTDFGVENEDTPFLVMEYIEGICLDDFLKKEKRLSPSKAFEIISPIARGVGVAHSQGITHRDLKPLNVMLRHGYPLAQAVKVLDFGLAKIKSTESFASLVQAKTANVLGSPHYMSPEQWANEDVDTRSDIYSLGVMLFQMLTGEVPFKGNSIPTIMYQHLQAPVPSLSSLGMNASPRIECVIQKALAKEQEQRFAVVDEFLYEFEKALSAKEVPTTSSSNIETAVLPDLDETTRKTGTNLGKDFANTYNLPYLNSVQNETLATYFNQPKSSEPKPTDKLEQQFVHAQNRAEAARTRVNEAEKLALEFNEAQKAAEDARRKVVEAQEKLEQDIRRRMQAEMETKLAAEIEAREKAEAEAHYLLEEVNARKEAEERANELAKTALEAQNRAEKERQKAEIEVRHRQHEENTRREAEAAALKLAEEVAEAKRKYEEAKKEAEAEAYFRLEAESKRRKVEEEIQRIAQAEAEKRQIAEAQAAAQIKEQTSRLEQQASEAQQKADQARRLAESEAQKREWAEMARIKAEEEARRLAEAIIEAQKQLEEAQQIAKSEAEKRALEESARIKAEEDARSSSLANQQNVESLKKDLLLQLEEAKQLAKFEAEKRALEEAARIKAEEEARSLSLSHENLKKSNQILQNQSAGNISSENPPFISNSNISAGFYDSASGEVLKNTSSSDILNTSQIVVRKFSNPVFLLAGFFVFLLTGGFGGYLFYRSMNSSSPVADDSNSEITNKNTEISKPELPARITEKMVPITGGTFQMGRDDVPANDNVYLVQSPQHPERVGSFYIDRTEVTNEEYARFIEETGREAPENWKDGKPPAAQEKFPVTFVSFIDAVEFADWISKRDNVLCQLPTEKEWEYAARSGEKQYIYPWGNDWIPNRANIGSKIPKAVGTSGDETEVGGIQDMLGNVWEWTSTPFKYYENFPEDKKVSGFEGNDYPTIRGSSFAANPGQIANKKFLLTFRQPRKNKADKQKYLGFRLVCYQ